ncbi:hypothetical protein MKX01_004873 [Papaver californicum]|nr:hypothetical protein MKX01_004873 [Papaver californicum]
MSTPPHDCGIFNREEILLLYKPPVHFLSFHQFSLLLQFASPPVFTSATAPSSISTYTLHTQFIQPPPVHYHQFHTIFKTPSQQQTTIFSLQAASNLSSATPSIEQPESQGGAVAKKEKLLHVDGLTPNIVAHTLTYR